MKKLVSVIILFVLVLGVAPVANASTVTVNRDKIVGSIKSGKSQVTLTEDVDVASDTESALNQIRASYKRMEKLFVETLKDMGLMYRGSISYSGLKYDLGKPGITMTLVYEIDNVKKGVALYSEKQAYQQAVKAYMNADTETLFYPADGDTDYYEVFELALYQHCEYFYNPPEYWPDGTIRLREQYYTSDKQQKYIDLADEKAERIADRINKRAKNTDQKIRLAHDYIVKHCDYDLSAVGKKEVTLSHTAYGCLVKGKAVCQGYAAALNLVLRKCGINSISVAGEANNGSHSWNMLKLGDKVYYYDCTFDDPVHKNGPKPNYVRWTFYKKSKSALAKTHTWDSSEYSTKYLGYSKFLLDY